MTDWWVIILQFQEGLLQGHLNPLRTDVSRGPPGLSGGPGPLGPHRNSTTVYRITWWKNTILAIFCHDNDSYVHVGLYILVELRTAPCYICWWERKFQGAKVPGCESSTPGTFAPGSEWSWEWKVHNSCSIVKLHTLPICGLLFL